VARKPARSRSLSSFLREQLRFARHPAGRSEAPASPSALHRRSQSGSTREGSGRTSSWISLAPKVRGCDKTDVHNEHVENFGVREDIPLKVPDDLVHPDADFAVVPLGDCQWVYMGFELGPLSSPIGEDLFLSENFGALRSVVISLFSPFELWLPKTERGGGDFYV
jgi:hypothetical protein